MKTIGFIGLGLIGGSIARTIRKFHPDYRLLAFDKDRDALAEAVSLNVIDGICDIEDERLYNCDYLFLCAPVEFNVEYMEKIKDSLGENCILTDVGSVKSIIHEKVTELGPRENLSAAIQWQAPSAAVFPIPVIISWKMLTISLLPEEKLLWIGFPILRNWFPLLVRSLLFSLRKNMISSRQESATSLISWLPLLSIL